jgi:two-component system sensor histidine kinase RegB
MESSGIAHTTKKKNFLLLVQLRWLAIIGQVVTIGIVEFVFGIRLPLSEMAAVIVFLILLNVTSLLLCGGRDAISNVAVFIALLLDIAALTAQFYLSGGATNPFIFLFILQVILGAVLLKTWSRWVIVAITSTCYIWLISYHHPIDFDHRHPGEFFNFHLYGMFICFFLAAILLVVFIGRINGNLRARDTKLAKLRQQAAEEDHIVRMGLLASGAAHELSTPLGTLAVILNDWQRIPALASNSELVKDIEEMEAQIARCKNIVSGILLSTGDARGEGTVRTTVNAFLDDVVKEWRVSRAPSSLAYTNDFGQDEVIVSDVALKQVIFNILDNAIEASPEWVGVYAERQDDKLVVCVHDNGTGFEQELLANFGRPYHSSKDQAGTGIGIFLVVNVVRKLGGAVTARNRHEGGAVVELVLPLASFSLRGVRGQ